MTAIDRILEPREPFGFEIAAGQRFRLHQVEGQQCADVLSFHAADRTERLSMYMSCAVNGTWKLTASHVLVSTRGRDLWEIEVDTVGENYSGGGFCNPYLNRRRFGDRGKATCLENLTRAAEPFGLTERDFDGDTCFNAFMRVLYEPDGAWQFADSPAEPGDELVLRALEDQVVVLSNCPQEWGPTNSGRPKTLGIQTLNA